MPDGKNLLMRMNSRETTLHVSTVLWSHVWKGPSLSAHLQKGLHH